MKGTSIRSPLAQARGLGAAKTGIDHWWEQRLTSIALLPLTFAAIVIVMSTIGRNHAAVRYAPSAKDLASRDVVSRSMTIEISRRTRCWREQGPHPPAPRPSRSQGAGGAAARHLRERTDLCRR